MFYTYLWLREDGTPYYVGKTGNIKRTVGQRHSVNPPPVKDRIVIQEWASEASSMFAEKFLISYYGRKDLGTGILHNHADGGEGAAGAVRSKSFREGVSRFHKGKSLSEEDKKKKSEAAKGNKNALGNKQSTETIEKRVSNFRGKHRSEETKRKLSDRAWQQWHVFIL